MAAAFQQGAFQNSAFDTGITGIVAPTQVITISLLPPAVRINSSIQPQTLFLNINPMRPYLSVFMGVAVLRDMPRLNPVYLVEITLKNNGPTLYFSDRGLEIGSRIYEDYLKELSGIGEELNRADSSALNADIALAFKNDPYQAYSYLVEIGDTYPFEAAECLIKEIYLTDIGGMSAPEVLFKGVLDEPSDIDLMGFKCKVSSIPYHKDRTWKQDVIDTTVYPNAYEDVGEVEPIAYGSDILMPALRTDWGARTTLKAEITESQASLELSDASRFPASGSVWIDNEKIGYASKTGNTLNSLTRGQSGTTATAHRKGAEAWEHKAAYESVLSGHELYSIGDIYAEIAGRLLRVDSGVSAVYENGKHKLKATEQIKVETVKDAIGVSDTIGFSSSSVSAELSDPTFEGAFVTPSSPYTYYFPASPSGTLLSELVAIDVANETVYPSITITIYCGGPYPVVKTIGMERKILLFYVPVGNTGMEMHINQGILSFFSAKKTVVYLPVLTKSGSASKTGDVVSTHTVERFHAVVSGYKDPDGNYGGLGNLIERPDYVIKHFLIKKLGFGLSDIDTASFNAAGALYASAISGGYKFAFEMDSKVKPSEFINRLALECRSTLKYEKGIWYLDYIPDAAPSAVKTISKEELAGQFEKFTFSSTGWRNVFNDLTAKFQRVYSRLESVSDWDGTAKLDDADSIAKYGAYPKDMEFGFIRLQAMADSVLAHKLLQSKRPFLVVRFPVFWEHFDLTIGDTIEIDNPLYDGRKFFIEEIKRDKQGKANITAIEWW